MGTLECTSMLDVIILLDGSGSVGETGWEVTQKIGEQLVQAFKTGDDAAQISVIAYGGPSTYDDYKVCISPKGPEDFAGECHVKWVSHWSTDGKSLAKAIKDTAMPGGSTMTASA